MTIAETKASLDAFSAGGREALRKYEDAAIALLGEATLSPARGSLMVAKEAIHVARLALLEAVERVGAVVDGPKARGSAGWGSSGFVP